MLIFTCGRRPYNRAFEKVARNRFTRIVNQCLPAPFYCRFAQPQCLSFGKMISKGHSIRTRSFCGSQNREMGLL
jgi:hypothetical protein